MEEIEDDDCGRREGGHKFGRGGDQNGLSDADHEAVGSCTSIKAMSSLNL